MFMHSGFDAQGDRCQRKRLKEACTRGTVARGGLGRSSGAGGLARDRRRPRWCQGSHLASAVFALITCVGCGSVGRHHSQISLPHGLQSTRLLATDLPKPPVGSGAPVVGGLRYFPRYDSQMMADRGFGCFPPGLFARLAWRGAVAQDITNVRQGAWTLCAYRFRSIHDSERAYNYFRHSVRRDIRRGEGTPIDAGPPSIQGIGEVGQQGDSLFALRSTTYMLVVGTLDMYNYGRGIAFVVRRVVRRLS